MTRSNMSDKSCTVFYKPGRFVVTIAEVTPKCVDLLTWNGLFQTLIACDTLNG